MLELLQEWPMTATTPASIKLLAAARPISALQPPSAGTNSTMYFVPPISTPPDALTWSTASWAELACGHPRKAVSPLMAWATPIVMTLGSAVNHSPPW